MNRIIHQNLHDYKTVRDHEKRISRHVKFLMPHNDGNRHDENL